MSDRKPRQHGAEVTGGLASTTRAGREVLDAIEEREARPRIGGPYRAVTHGAAPAAADVARRSMVNT